MAKENSVLESVLAEFSNLAAIPRQSGHEEAVSNFLKKYLTDMGLTVVQDEAYNIIAEKKAAPGFEKAPLTIIQAHMDMVCVARPGVEYNPLTDSIKLVRDEKFLRAEGTSLGADDGIGIATAIHVLKNLEEHGTIRLIITVDEERGMTGAKKLDPKYLLDADFVINCDSEDYDVLTVGCAGGVRIGFSRQLKRVENTYANNFSVEVKGLLGGHSGENIGDGSANAIKTLGVLLTKISKLGGLSIVSIDGGQADNAIASEARAIIATDIPQDEIEEVIAAEKEDFAMAYGSIDKNAEFLLGEVPTSGEMLSAGDTKRTLELLTVLHSGVFAMSREIPGLVETSANIGIIKTTADELTISYYARSSVDSKVAEFELTAKALGEMTGFSAECADPSPGWKENKNSKLTKIAAEIFEEQNKRPIKIEAIHAGLECGYFFKINPKLDIISLGTNNVDIHSPNEHLELDTVEPHVNLVMETVRRIAKLNK